ncbi:hypothetical protein FJV14_00065 [Acinetobacter baumannii]|uniref:hypothetical protein n=1 Tax=Acinetobacter baumannii TaxID=470 RepID=UPI001128E471|nr:hypothetical protein [Acinetobacter baumannii]TPS05800.1 hypothetical protein FJV14_00065 [Acinetobacter baumannii]
MNAQVNLESLIKSESYVCRACVSTTNSRFLSQGGYTWHCKCGVNQRVWTCSKDYQTALEKVLAA